MNTVNGSPIGDWKLCVGYRGLWFLDADCFDVAELDLAEQVTVKLGDLTLLGKATAGPAYLDQRSIQVVAGNGGWGSVLPARSYHNDAGVKVATVLADLAKAAGETIGTVPETRLGADFFRESGLASTALEAAIKSTNWFVDYDGVTQISDREATSPDPAHYSVLSYSPRRNDAKLSVDDPSVVTVGSQLEIAGQTLTVRSLKLESKGNKLLCEVWFGDATNAGNYSDDGDLLLRIIRKELSKMLLGVYRYRVVRMNNDRADIQPVDESAGLPNASNVELAFAVLPQLAPSCEVGVIFLNGDRSEPRIISCAGATRANHQPTRLDLGGTEGYAAAFVGSIVNFYFPPASLISGLLDGVPFSGTMTAVQAATGVIQSGSTKVFVKP